MKNLHLPFVALAFLVLSSCASVKQQVRQLKQEESDAAVKGGLKDFLSEREENLEKYNVTCEYTDRLGTILITEIDTLENQQIRVYYSFKPKTPSAIDKEYEMADRNRTLIIDGKYPTMEWCEANGIKERASFPGSRMELVKGYKTEYCEQVKYNIPTLGK
ncbi:hypothetical protein FKX85_05830 [Echinicola soli]|uniref:Lipoprotein n=1 Tax=Echinicola soli TaxID=2591634 RepID=A0A514CFJ6_9BACT|nr:hypothetical protein [Echinicola soli]QDH78576.1 hypothetical protein FKX85_05830 [Echinicola soli]